MVGSSVVTSLDADNFKAATSRGKGLSQLILGNPVLLSEFIGFFRNSLASLAAPQFFWLLLRREVRVLLLRPGEMLLLLLRFVGSRNAFSLPLGSEVAVHFLALMLQTTTSIHAILKKQPLYPGFVRLGSRIIGPNEAYLRMTP